MAASLLRAARTTALRARPGTAARRFASVDVTIREALNMAMDEEMEADDAVFVSDYNANRVLVFDGVPSAPNTLPSAVLGAPDLETDTFETHHFITNGCAASNGESLCIGDGYDMRLYCWATIPTESDQTPTGVFDFQDGVTSLAMHGDQLVGAGPMRGIRHWKSLPLNGEPPDALYEGQIGSVSFNRVTHVALDGTYFYALDDQKALHGWPGVPEGNEAPAFTLQLEGPEPYIHSDGTYLTLSTRNSVALYDVSTLETDPTPQLVTGFAHSSHLGQALAADGHLFVTDFNHHRVYAWEDLQDALDGSPPDALLGASDPDDVDPDTRRDGLFWPNRLAWDGQNLWVGEYKFSGRVVGFQRP